MAYKSILTLRMPNDGTGPLDAAIAFAEAAGAHLHVLCISVDQTRPESYMVGTAGVALMDVGFEQAIAAKEELEAATRERLAGMQGGWSIEAVALPGVALGSTVADRARFADLVILPRPYADSRPHEAPMALEAAMFRGRAPVLVVPDDSGAPLKPQRLIIAWNDSPEALAAIRAGMPFIQSAKTTEILVIDPPQHGPEAADPGALLAEMLARHGARVTVALVARTAPRISDMLQREILDRGADMVILGAYSHSRFREAILGGTTRNMLEWTNIPVLMAH
ncbi:universal stress protein [Rhodobacterales bacterium HKCCE3408]|nr:universal stress protein [Rhodobacterales bacterium HKCCE3408]